MAYAEGFSRTQVTLHWATVGSSPSICFRGRHRRRPARLPGRHRPRLLERLDGQFSRLVGILILLMVLLRLFLRLVHGVPAPPPGDSKDMQKIASLVVLAFYVLLLVMPATGIIAYYFQEFWVGEIHEWGKPFLLGPHRPARGGRPLASLLQANDVLRRILRPGPPPPHAP